MREPVRFRPLHVSVVVSGDPPFRTVAESESQRGPASTRIFAGSELLIGFTSPEFESVTIFVYTPAGIVLKATAFTRISANDCPTESVLVVVQRNERFPFPVIEHVHGDGALIEPEIVTPFGKVSSTIVVPDAVTAHRFVIVYA